MTPFNDINITTKQNRKKAIKTGSRFMIAQFSVLLFLSNVYLQHEENLTACQRGVEVVNSHCLFPVVKSLEQLVINM